MNDRQRHKVHWGIINCHTRESKSTFCLRKQWDCNLCDSCFQFHRTQHPLHDDDDIRRAVGEGGVSDWPWLVLTHQRGLWNMPLQQCHTAIYSELCPSNTKIQCTFFFVLRLSPLRKNLFPKQRAGQRTYIWVIEVVEAFVWEGTGLKQRTKKLRLLQIQNMITTLGSTQWKMNLLDVEMSILLWIVRRGLLTCAGSDRRSHFKGSVRSNTPLSLSLVLHTTTTAIYYFYFY